MLKKLEYSQYLKALKGVFTLTCLLFFSYHIYSSSELLGLLLSRVEWQWFALALFILMLQTSVGGLFTFILAAPFSNNLTLPQMMQIHVLRLPAKYLPGGVWHVVSKLSDLRRKGLSLGALTKVALFETVVPIAVTFTLGGVCVLVVADVPELWNIVVSLVVTAFFLFVVSYSCFFRVGLFRKFLINKHSFYLSFVVVCIYWTIAGFGFCFYLINLLGVLSISKVFEVWGIYLFSWGVGNVAVFSPQGVGVLEWAVSSMLTMEEVGMGSMMVIVAGYRLIMLISDLLYFLIFSLYRAFQSRG